MGVIQCDIKLLNPNSKAWKLVWKGVIDTRTYQFKWRQEDGANQYRTTGKLPDTLPKTQRLNPNPKSQPFILNCKTVTHNP